MTVPDIRFIRGVEALIGRDGARCVRVLLLTGLAAELTGGEKRHDVQAVIAVVGKQ